MDFWIFSGQNFENSVEVAVDYVCWKTSHHFNQNFIVTNIILECSI
jgi:hypothetical protein